MAASDGPGESYWDLLRDIAHLQGEMGQDLVAWARAYEAGGRAFQQNGQTLAHMAELGRRLERYLQTGPSAAVRQALQLFHAPYRGTEPGPGAGMADPFSRFWQFWASGLPSAEERGGPEGGTSEGSG
jgi:hypothetical protein